MKYRRNDKEIITSCRFLFCRHFDLQKDLVGGMTRQTDLVKMHKKSPETPRPIGYFAQIYTSAI